MAGLRAEGLKPGDCVCIHSFNDIYYPILHLAVIGAGGVFTGSNPAYTSVELSHHVRTAHAKYIISEPRLLSVVRESAQECSVPTSNIFVFDAVDKGPFEGLRSWQELLEHGEQDWVRFKDPQSDETTIAMYAFTSGSTGLPKAAMITHKYLVYMAWAIQSRGKPYEVSRLFCIPPFHVYGLPLITGCAMRERHSVYLLRRFDIAQYLDAIERFGTTETAMVPAMISALLNSPLTSRERLRSLRFVWSAGSLLGPPMQADLRALLSPEAKISQSWGLTEAGWVTTLLWPDGDQPGSVGRALPGVTIRSVSDNGESVEVDDTKGELYVKAPAMMLGYLNNPEATSAIMTPDGWLRTGDIGYCKEGRWYIVDRKRDLIKVRGWQVAPAEIESVLLSHPDIIGATVVGIPDANGTGEVPRAYVVRKPQPPFAAETGDAQQSVSVSEEDIKTFVARHLARYKYLEGGVQFVEQIPRNAMGKVVKSKLLDMYRINRHA